MKRAAFTLIAVFSLLSVSILPAKSQTSTVCADGAWCWFADPRALHYETPDGRIDATYLGYIDNHGNVKAMQYDFRNRKQTEVLVRSYFQPDDHDNPTFLALPDGRIVIFYSRHTDEPCFYYRISSKRGDITTLGDEKVLATKDNTTYPSPFMLATDPDHIYLCWRGINWHPTIARLTLPDANGNMHFDWGPYQIVQSTGARPYAKYASDGKSKIFLAYTTGHPDNEDPNFLYLNYIDINDMSLRDINGEKLSDIASGTFKVDKSDEFVKKYPATVVDASPYRDWLSQVAIDRNGNPVIAMTRISKDKKSHNYYLARRNGDNWQLSHVANAGGHFHQSPDIEHCYSGGMSIDPANTNIVYCSVPVAGQYGKVYEIVRFQLDANGEIVAMKAITNNSKKNNSRPYAIPGASKSQLKLGWMNGDYYDWIVSSVRPEGYPTKIMTDFAGFDCNLVPTATMPFAFNPNEDFVYTVTINPANGGALVSLGDLTYSVPDTAQLYPVIKYKKKQFKGCNRLANSDSWKSAPRATDGKWHKAVPLKDCKLTLEYKDGVLKTYINGALDQNVRLAPSKAVAAEVFELNDPDFKRSPYTGMTRKHWLDAAKYLLSGAFGYINSLDDPMYFPKQLDKTYPRDEGGVAVAKLEGLARTFFLAAPLLREDPELTLNGIKVADYYRHQIKNLVKEGSTSYTKCCPNSPSQTLLELGSICLSLKIAEDAVWNTFTQEEKDALAFLFKSYGEGPTIESNWRFFNVFVLSFLKGEGYDIDEEYLTLNLTRLLERYRGEGWYNDSPAYDYYSMWAFQTYGPLWAQLWGTTQRPEIAKQFMANQHDMVANYPYMFSKDGKMNMWGRSLPYRFAAVSPFALLEYDESGDVNYGWIRRISSSSLLQFMQDPGFLEDGIPTMGYFGVFAPAVQIYSCRGSVYWIGKAFFNLLLPEDSKYWSAVENNGPWENELKPGKAYNKFQPATNLLITDYPDCGGAEMRSWCHETVASDWQQFRSSENYNKLAYHTEFPWMADGSNGEISMNYGTLNGRGDWEVLRLYDFQSFDNGVYRRDAVLETDNNVKYQLADIPLAGGVLRVDKVTLPKATDIRLGSYSLPDVGKGFTSKSVACKGGSKALTLGNDKYQLAVVPLLGWNGTEAIYPYGLHPVSDQCALIVNTDNPDAGSKIYITLQLWKKGDKRFSDKELNQVKSIDVSPDQSKVTVTLADGEVKVVNFE